MLQRVTLRKWDRDREFLPWVIVVCLVTLAFFLVLIIFFENPFARIWQPPLGAAAQSHVPARRGQCCSCRQTGAG